MAVHVVKSTAVNFTEYAPLAPFDDVHRHFLHRAAATRRLLFGRGQGTSTIVPMPEL